MRRNRSVVLGGALLLGLLLIGIAAPALAPYDPTATDLARTLELPGRSHLLGTDSYGRDLLSRLIWGARVSLALALGATLIAFLGGAALGMLAGALPGWLSLLFSLVIDILLVLPGFLLAMAIVAAHGPSLATTTLAVGIAYIPRVALIVRSVVLRLRATDYVQAARAIGASYAGIMWRTILPNCLPALIVTAAISGGSAILAEASLSFLGIGVQPPVASWGSIVAEGGGVLQSHPRISLSAGACIALAVVAINLLGDGLRDLFDPTLGSRLPS